LGQTDGRKKYILIELGEKIYFKRASNSSAVRPAVFIKFLKRLGFSYLCFGTASVTFEPFFLRTT
jgi:hypothetical protein